MKALTVCQPHTWAIIHGDKPYENRSWYCHYRGPLLIHAGKSRSHMDEDDWGDEPEYRQYPGQPHARELAFGAIVGVVDVVGCKRPGDCGGHPTAEGPWCIVLANRRALPEPVPCAGMLGLWGAPAEIEARVKAQLEGSEARS